MNVKITNPFLFIVLRYTIQICLTNRYSIKRSLNTKLTCLGVYLVLDCMTH